MLAACGNEVGRVACDGTGALTTTTVQLPSSDSTVLWTDLDVQWEGAGGLLYTIEGYRDGKQIYSGSCSPLDVNTKMMSSETHIGDEHSVSYQGKLGCPTLEGGGTVEIKGKLEVEGDIAIAKCDLVLKQ